MLIPKYDQIPKDFMTFEKHSLQKKEIRTNKIKQVGEESLQREVVFNNHRSIREEPEPLIQKEKDTFFFTKKVISGALGN